MERRLCGRTDLELSILGLGCWEFGGGDYWGPQTQAEADAVIREAVNHGINYFDTAEAYNEGRSEEALGRAIKGLPRDRLVIGSKVSPSNAYKETLIRHCEESLKRLGTEYLDIYMIHWPLKPHSIRHFTDKESIIAHPPGLPEAMDAIETLIADGKVRYAGVSNFGAGPLDDAIACGPEIIVNELPYNLLARAIEFSVLPLCRDRKIGVIGYFTLLQGVLSGRYRNLSDIPTLQRRTRHFNSEKNELSRHGGGGMEEETAEALRSIRDLADGAGLSMASLAIQWAVANPDLTCALVGTRKPSRIRANAEAVAKAMPQDLKNLLDEATLKLRNAMEPGFDYYESLENDRTI